MKIAFTSKGINWDSKVDPRFGRTEYILVYDDQNDELTHYDNREIERAAHGAGPQTSQKLFDLGAKILITGNGPGGNAATVLEKVGIKTFVGAGDITVKQAYDLYKKGELTPITHAKAKRIV